MSNRRPTLLLSLIALVACAGLLAACGDDDEGGETVTVTTEAQDTTEVTEESTTDATTETAEEDAGTDPVHFQTPTGNIGCYVDVNAARCDISERTWNPTPEPSSCKKTGLDYGQGIIVTHDHAEFVCAGDTTLGGEETLAYGDSVERGEYLCESEPDGVTCTERETGHGFFISRKSFRIF
jgi:hypothetical protein